MDDLATDEDIERLRRSMVMLTPGHPGGLSREAALQVLEELQRLKSRDKRAAALLDDLRRLLVE